MNSPEVRDLIELWKNRPLRVLDWEDPSDLTFCSNCLNCLAKAMPAIIAATQGLSESPGSSEVEASNGSGEAPPAADSNSRSPGQSPNMAGSDEASGQRSDSSDTSASSGATNPDPGALERLRKAAAIHGRTKRARKPHGLPHEPLPKTPDSVSV